MDDACLATLAAALDYLRHGWSVMSLCPHDHVGVGKLHRGCRSPGKSPFFPNLPPGRQNLWKQHQIERATPEQVRGWWSLGHELNVGVALGSISGIVAIDVDDEDGETLLRELSGGDLPKTLEYTTGKGRRLIYRLPEGASVRSIPFKRAGTQIEILRFMGGGSQIVLPPSIHPSGAKYRWVAGKAPADMEAAVAPEWMIAARTAEAGSKTLTEGELIDEHGRNNFLTSLAGSIRKHGAHEEVIYAALTQMNTDRCNPPLDDAEVRKISRSMMRYEPDEYAGVTIKQAKQKERPAVADDGRKFLWFSELTNPEKADEWIWQGYLPRRGIVLLSALWKIGKTTLLAHLLKALGSDGLFLGQPIKASKILYVSEEGVQHWVRRRDQLGIDGQYAGLYSQPFDTKPNSVQWNGFVDDLVEDVKNHGFDLVIVDTLAKLWPVREENDSVDVDTALMPLKKITDAGASILLIHHMRKSGGTEYTGSRGSGALSAFPDIVMEMVRFDALDNKCKKRILRAKGRYDETIEELVIELRDGAYEAVVSAEAAAPPPVNGVVTVRGDSEEAKILSVLGSSPDPWLTMDEIRAYLSASKSGMRSENVITHLFSLYSRKLVLMDGQLRSKNNPRVYGLASRPDLIPSPSDPGFQGGKEMLEGDDKPA